MGLAPPGAHAQAAPPHDQIATELIGAVVFAADGTEVGEVSAIATGPAGEVTELRVTMGAPLGLGVRTVIAPQGSFVLLRGAVVLELTVEQIDALPAEGRTSGPIDRNSL